MGLFDMFRDALARAEARIDAIGGDGLPMAFAKIYPGGLPAFLDRLREAGHGAAVSSWLGSGANVALPAGAYAALLSPEAVTRFAADLGVPEARVPTALAEFLPGAVDRQSRDGTLAPQRQFSTQVASGRPPTGADATLRGA